MIARPNYISLDLRSFALLFRAMSSSTSAISVEVAKKCNALTASVSTESAGNPAAISAKGAGKEMQDSFRKCVENGDKMTESNK